jgi:hypothetical protein
MSEMKQKFQQLALLFDDPPDTDRDELTYKVSLSVWATTNQGAYYKNGKVNKKQYPDNLNVDAVDSGVTNYFDETESVTD